jgi:phage terminase large subunit-like protein
MASTTSALPAGSGAQEPRLHSFPPYVSTAGPEAVELASRAGLNLYPWQQLVLRDALGETAEGKWAAFEVGLVCPRQSGKGSILEALEIAALYLADPDAPPPLILHSAHEFKTSAEHFRRVRDLIEGSPLLSKQVRIIRTAAGAEAIELHSGARLRFVTRSGGSGRGFSADLVVIDEAYNLTAESMAAVLPTLSARPNPQIWYTSSAGMISSEQLARVRDRGIKGGDPSLAYFEWSAADGSDLDDRNAWRQANPSMGLRIPESFIVTERAALPDEQFGRERLGLWADRDRDKGAIDPALWSTLADANAERGPDPVFAVATAPDRSWSAIAVAWRRPDGLPQVMLADYRRDATWVAERVDELRSRWRSPVLTDTASRGLVLDAEEPSQAEQAKAHNALSDAVLAGAIHHGNEPAMNTAVRAARWKPSGDTRVLDRKGSTDISPLVAAALAVHGLSVARPSVYESRALLTL